MTREKLLPIAERTYLTAKLARFTGPTYSEFIFIGIYKAQVLKNDLIQISLDEEEIFTYKRIHLTMTSSIKYMAVGLANYTFNRIEPKEDITVCNGELFGEFLANLANFFFNSSCFTSSFSCIS